MRIVRSGVTRDVLLTGRLAIKIPKLTSWRLFLLGLLANMQERTFARAGWAELCPVIFSVPGGWLTVMRRADPLSPEEWETFDVEAFCDRPDYFVPVEPKRDSFGKVNGRIVAVDYGN